MGSQIWWGIASFLILMFVFITTFSVMGWLLYGATDFRFRDANWAMTFCWRWSLVGGAPFADDDLEALSPTLSPLMFVLWILLIDWLSINVVLAILLAGWEQVNEQIDSDKKSRGV